MTTEQTPNSYAASGVNYDILDPIKQLAQSHASLTAPQLRRFPNTKEVEESRGESAYVWEEEGEYRATVIEGLGTKNLVADTMRAITGKTYYHSLAQDTVAMIINDLIVVNADPQVISAYWAVGDSNWLADRERAENLIKGWRQACDMAGVTWAGGETPTLKGIVSSDTIELAGSAVGVIKPKERLVLGEKLQAGDAILFVESNGIHANGLTLARQIADKLPEGYGTQLSDGTMYGEALLKPTHIYSNLVRNLNEHGVDVHYMVNITGHGFRKLMRAEKELSYVIDTLPDPQEVFTFMQQQSGMNDEEMYGTFNMGAGFAIFVPNDQVNQIIQIGKEQGLKITHAGHVEDGPRQVVIGPKNIVFPGSSLEVR